MSRFESSKFIRNPQVMHVEVLKSACDALGWTYRVIGNELMVTNAKQGTKLYGEFALKLNLTTNEVTYNTYYMPNATQKVEELQNQFYALNAAYAKKSLVQEFKKKGKTILFVSHDLSAISKYCDRAVLLNQGEKLGEGSPKEMIDAYKQVLVGQYETPRESENVPDLAADPGVREAVEERDREQKGQQPQAGVNPETLEYGTKEAEIFEYFLTDSNGVRTTAILKGDPFTMHMRVKIHRDLPAPIFALSIKNIKGVEITGTNTMFEKSFLDSVKAGQTLEITFSQRMLLQGGDYLISLGVTGYEKDEFTVYHRLYDVLNITVVSDKDTVGYFDMESKVEVKEI